MKVKVIEDGQCVMCDGRDCMWIANIHGIVHLFGSNGNRRCREVHIYDNEVSELNRKINAPIRMTFRKAAIVVNVMEDDWDTNLYYIKRRKK
jgi:hypothetical protein